MAGKLPKGGLRVLLKWWAEVLRIQDWRIKLTRQFEDKYPSTEGSVTTDPFDKTATINVDPRAQDPELILVHECIHIVQAPIIDLEPGSVAEEVVVWTLAGALVSLKRKAYAKKTEGSEGIQRREAQRQAKGKKG